MSESLFIVGVVVVGSLLVLWGLGVFGELRGAWRERGKDKP